MPERTKFGIIGCSRIANRSVIPAIRKSENAELGIIGSRSTERAKETAGKFECRKFGTYQDVLNSDVDAVYISLPISMHEEWAVKAANAGKHVLCEKSSTTSYLSAQKMVLAAKQNNTRLMEGFMFRFHPQHQKIKEIISEKRIGDLFLFNGNYGFPPVSHDDIRYDAALGGGILNETGCYPVCASRMIFNEEPTSVTCDLVIDSSGIDVKGHASILFGDDKAAVISFSFESYYQANYRVWGKSGLIEVNRAYAVPSEFVTTIHLHTENSKEEFKAGPTDHFIKMVDSFCKEISGIEKSSYNFEQDLLDQAKLMESLRLSNKSKKRMYLTDL
ncbi:MAG: gfo/Idh/MocA family oxidoreductase [Nitrosopumilaceae archaeon]|nr:gfo/Idh/MocA family oxidoreductase [Nitrosopumilaceae archaeon]